MVHFIDEVISKGEAVKGQALFTTMVTVTTVFSSLAGGMILDFADAKMLTGIASVATAAGALIFILFTDKVKRKSA
jgi:PPP family 3-phenylpropionic acid transporter